MEWLFVEKGDGKQIILKIHLFILKVDLVMIETNLDRQMDIEIDR